MKIGKAEVPTLTWRDGNGDATARAVRELIQYGESLHGPDAMVSLAELRKLLDDPQHYESLTYWTRKP